MCHIPPGVQVSALLASMFIQNFKFFEIYEMQQCKKGPHDPDFDPFGEIFS